MREDFGMWENFDWVKFFDGLVFLYWEANLRTDLTDCFGAGMKEGAD